jgi:hypothetical protein
LVLAGEAFDTVIDDFVESWHQRDSKLSLAEFLGFAEEEYATWVAQPKSLESIIASHKGTLGRS